MRKLWIAFSVVLLAGCASSSAELQRATATSVGGNLAPDQVAIVDVNRGLTEVSWTATAGGRNYACSADDMVRRTSCVRR
jgi:hypothetical protein